MIHKKVKEGRFLIRNARASDVTQMVEVQLACFPTLAKDELLNEAHFLNHIKVFPEGQLVVVEGDKVVGSSSNLRVHLPKANHSFMEITDQLWITNTHIEDGEWSYQFDIGILPDYRGLKLSTEIYKAQQEMVKTLGMKGQITVGMTIGYADYQDRYSIEEYCELLKNEVITDPTVTAQRKAGFQWIRPIFDYVIDPTAGNCSILMVYPTDGIPLPEFTD